MPKLETLWYSRSAHPCPLGLAAQLGWFLDEFRDDALRVFTVQNSTDASVRDSHVDHHLPYCIRQGGNVTAIWARSSGARTRLVGLSWLDEFQGILSLPDSGIRAPQDLRRRRIGLPVASDSLVDNMRSEALHGFLATLSLAGLGAGDVQFVDLPRGYSRHSPVPGWAQSDRFGGYQQQIAALLRREVDAVYVKGARGLHAAREAHAHVVLDLREHPDPAARVHNGTPRPITVDERLLHEHPQVVERFLARVVAVGGWAENHPRETVAYLGRETHRSEEVVRAAYGDDVHRRLHTDLAPAAIEALKAHKRFLLQWGFIQEDFDLDGWIDPAPLAAARRRADDELLQLS